MSKVSSFQQSVVHADAERMLMWERGSCDDDLCRSATLGHLKFRLGIDLGCRKVCSPGNLALGGIVSQIARWAVVTDSEVVLEQDCANMSCSRKFGEA
jgi:hypothetical protein